jgi:hypothetical protein
VPLEPALHHDLSRISVIRGGRTMTCPPWNAKTLLAPDAAQRRARKGAAKRQDTKAGIP